MRKASISSIRMSKKVPAALAFVMLAAGDVFAATAGRGSDDPAHAAHEGPGLLYPYLNLILYVLLLVYAYRKAGKGKLIEQHTDVKQHLSRAAAELSEAESSFEAAERRLNDIEQEKAELINALNREGTQMAELAIAKAERSVEASFLDTERRIQNEFARAEAELRNEVVSRSTELARERVLARMSSDDDARLRREALQRIG